MSFVARPPQPLDMGGEGRDIPPSVPADFFLSISHDLFAIGTLHRSERDAFKNVLSANEARKMDLLVCNLGILKAASECIASLTANLQAKIAASADDYESSTNVYGA